MNLNTTQQESFKLIGISIRTSNAEGQAAQDIPQLWQAWVSDNIIERIPNKIDHMVYAVYTHYDGDHRAPYSMILGCRVSSLEEIPTGMLGHEVAAGTYAHFHCKGDLTQGLVYQAWLNIWQMDFERTYQSDFEVYGPKAQNPLDAEVDIFVGIRDSGA